MNFERSKKAKSATSVKKKKPSTNIKNHNLQIVNICNLIHRNQPFQKSEIRKMEETKNQQLQQSISGNINQHSKVQTPYHEKSWSWVLKDENLKIQKLQENFYEKKISKQGQSYFRKCMSFKRSKKPKSETPGIKIGE